ncbi:MAG: HAMP domain-containing protein, partial [Anaerolineae bacterium]|nr:HAMP domain-containing protein [Anaerolineae bacterium]
MKRLWVQQTVAFALVVIVAMGAVVFWINRGADLEFREYVTLSDIRLSGSGLQELVAFYRQRGSWEGVESLLGPGVYFDQDGHMALGTVLIEGEWGWLQEKGLAPEIRLVDAGGQVVFDSQGQANGKQLSSKELVNAWPIANPDDGEIIGYLLLLFSYTKPLDEQAQVFLDRVKGLLLASTALAVGLIVVVGALLNRRLNAPLQRLAAATRAVAAGDLDQQVETAGSSEVAQVGQAFNEMTAALKQAEALRQNMVADVAHELRTPLSVLQGNLWAILNDAYPLEKAEISRLYDETRLLSRLVEDLRELALADAGQLSLDLRPTDVGQIARQTVDSFALVAEAQEVSLVTECPTDLAPVQA